MPFTPYHFGPGLLETMICVWCFIAGLIVYIIRLIIFAKKYRRKNHNSDDNNHWIY